MFKKREFNNFRKLKYKYNVNKTCFIYTKFRISKVLYICFMRINK